MPQQITYQKMAKLFARLDTSYRAGIDLLTAYNKERSIGSPADRLKANRVVSGLKEGKSLADSMSALGGYFPELALAVVKAGEAGGRLEDAFKRLAKHYRDLVNFRNKFLMSIAWPTFELLASVFVVGAMILIMHFVMVNIGGAKDSIDWFGMGSTTGNFIFYVTAVTLFFGSVFVLIFGSIKGWFGILPMRIARRIPVLGKTIECLALSRLAWTMSVAENAGMDALENAQLSLAATENYYYRQAEEQIASGLRGGDTFYQAFQSTDTFPQEFLDYIDVGETAGELSETMERASSDLQQKAEENLKILGTIGFVLMFLFVAIVIAVAVITLYYQVAIKPVNDLLNGL